MSLEAALAENTAALNRVAALLEQSNAGREAAIAKLTDAGTTAADKPATTRRGRPPAAEKKAEPETKPAETPAAPAASGPKTVEDVRNAAIAFMGPKDSPERPARSEFVRAVNAHLGIEKIADCAGHEREKVIGWLDAKLRGEDVNFSDGEDEPAAEEDDDEIG